MSPLNSFFISPFHTHTQAPTHPIPRRCALLHSSSVWMPMSATDQAASGPKPPKAHWGFTRYEIRDISTNVALDAKSDRRQICLLTELTGCVPGVISAWIQGVCCKEIWFNLLSNVINAGVNLETILRFIWRTDQTQWRPWFISGL